MTLAPLFPCCMHFVCPPSVPFPPPHMQLEFGRVTCGIASGASLIGTLDASHNRYHVVSGPTADLAQGLQFLCALYNEGCLMTSNDTASLAVHWDLQWLDIIRIPVIQQQTLGIVAVMALKEDEEDEVCHLEAVVKGMCEKAALAGWGCGREQGGGLPECRSGTLQCQD